jgi:ankyrin repeat protein
MTVNVNDNEDELDTRLDLLLRNQEWDAVSGILQGHPALCRKQNHRSGRTILHQLCSYGSTPPEVIALAAAVHPSAITIPDTYIGDTCLHLVARNSQFSSAKLKCLLDHCTPESLLIRNHMGGTPLHSAANHNAVLSALQSLVEANPAVLKISTHDGISAVTAMWLAYIQTIPGHMVVVQVLNGEKIESAGFNRFWEKVEYLVLQHFRSLPSCPLEAQSGELPSRFLLHGMLRWSVPLNMLKVCMYHRPESAMAVDSDGNLPLHVLIESRPYRLKEREAIQTWLEVTPRSLAAVSNAAGDVALQIAIRNRIPVTNGVDLLLAAAPTTIRWRDVSTGLYPFQLAAIQGTNATIVTLIFYMLRHQPDLVLD